MSVEDSLKNYRDNLEYIRQNFIHLEPVHFYTDQKTESTDMSDIWSRLSYIGYNMMVKNEVVFQNIARARSKTMDSAVKNLVNAIFCCCLI